MRALLAIALASGCASDLEPAATFRILALDASDPDVSEYSKGARAWALLGIVEDETSDTVITFERWPDLRERHNVNGLADRATGRVILDSHLRGFELWVVVAHEIGHVVLDTSRHGACGVMGSTDVALCDEDRAIACEEAGFCAP